MTLPQQQITTETAADTGLIRFAIRIRPLRYGNGRTFHEYQILMRRDGKVVGVEDGPRRTHIDMRSARSAGFQRIRELKTHRLYIIEVTKKDIDNSEAHSCRACAVAQALYRNQERMGFDQWKFEFMVEPYGAFVKCDGIILSERNYPYTRRVSGQRNMPDLVAPCKKQPGFYVTSMYEWTIHWDEWQDSLSMTLKEWREEHVDDESKPYRPSPCSFVLNLDVLHEKSEDQ